MASTSRYPSIRPVRWSALLAFALLAPAVALAGDEPAPGDDQAVAKAAPSRTVVVGKATLNWHLKPAASAKRSGFVEAFAKATEAHLTGAEPVVTPKTEPTILAGGQPMLRLPAELVHTMFVGPEGHNYCSDSTVPAKAAAVSNADGEGR